MNKNIENKINSDIKIYYWKNQSPCDEILSKYDDILFPPNNNSLFGKNEFGDYIDKLNGEKNSKKLKKFSIKWLRPKNIFNKEKYFLFQDKNDINISNIRQGNINDCYFISSIIGLGKYSNLIFKLFKNKEINSKGYYEIKLFIEGSYQRVIVDDYLPVFNNTNELCFSKSIKNEIWICLLEKAWAKINGGYANIIDGFAHHVLETLTGFPCYNLMHSSFESQIIWDIIINCFNHSYIMTTTSKDDNDININNIGLESNHSYTLIDYNIINNNKTIIIRDPKGKLLLSKEENSKLKNKKEISLINLFFEDYYKYLSFTNICYIITNCYSKTYKIEGNDIHKGNIFNIYLKEDCFLSINLIRKNRIFNREVNKIIFPSFICLIKYFQEEINNNNFFFNNEINNIYFTDYYSNIESEENISINKELKKGHYLFYSYVNYNYSLINNKENYFIKFDSNKKVEILKKPCDIKENGFPVLKYIKIYIFLNANKNVNFKDGFNHIIKYKNKDLAMKVVYNRNNKWLKIIEDCSELTNIFILNPYRIENRIFEWYIPPNKIDILFGLVIETSKEGSLNLKSKNYLIKYVPIDYKKYETNISQYITTEFK